MQCHFFCSCSCVKISSMTEDWVESPPSSAAFCKSSKCFRQSSEPSFASFYSWYCVIWIWIITLLYDIILGSNRWERRQSLTRFRGSGGPNPRTNFLMRASNHRRDNQRPTSGLHLMWLFLYLVQFFSK
jgi:hypothetical protein